MEDIGNTTALVVQRRAPKRVNLNREAKSSGELFEQLDSRVTPGITGVQFQRLFNQCECGLVMTRRAFSMHKCINFIDLTQEVSDTE